ncbi:hypothetical protein [Leisingera thetidis]|uniref:ABC transporter ATP-binding protein n=1 Tax=Leisingera thetidis TaxID=2930199 RepID=UPI0033130FB6
MIRPHCVGDDFTGKTKALQAWHRGGYRHGTSLSEKRNAINLAVPLGLTYFFISHDLAVVRYLCDRVALIYRGELVEEGDTDQIFDHPESEYTRMLIGAMPEVQVPQSAGDRKVAGV